MRFLSLALVSALLLAGCADTTTVVEETDDLGKDKVRVDANTGAIRGVVVDQTISPVPGALVRLKGADAQLESTSDAEGLFIFNQLDPGTYFVTVTKQYYSETQSSVQVQAGVTPDLVRVQIDQLFDTQPFLTREKFDGYFQCAYNALVSSTCINDYTRICTTTPPCCAGGCFPELSSLVDHREYVTVLDADWSTINIELNWESSLAGTADTMGLTVSYKARVGASHNWGSFSGPAPMVARIDVTGVGGHIDDFPGKIPYEGIDDLFVFMSAGSGNLALGQTFQVFQTTSYVAPLPEGYSFINGDDDPF